MDTTHPSTGSTDTVAAPPVRAASTIERAYQLAREGPSATLDDIRRQLEQERYASVNAHLAGPTIRRQLRQLCKDRIGAGAVE